MTNDTWAAKVATQLEHVVKHGMPDCYTGVEDWLFDFYPDLPWDPVESAKVAHVLLISHAGVLEAFQTRFAFDLATELKLHIYMSGEMLGKIL